MVKRPLLPAGIIAFSAALCVIQLIRAEAKTWRIRPGPASGAGISSSGHDPEEAFLKENAAGMDKMMAGMNVRPTGDVDADFAAMMIPHTRVRSTWRWPSCATARMSNCVVSRRRSSSINSRKSSRCAWRLARSRRPRTGADADPRQRPIDHFRARSPGHATGTDVHVPKMKMQ